MLKKGWADINGLVQNCSNSIANALELRVIKMVENWGNEYERYASR